MTHLPDGFRAPPLSARRIAPGDLAFVQALMARPELSAHKPVPHPSSPEDIAKAHAANLAHWETHGFGRYVVVLAGPIGPIGLCGLTRKAGVDGINLSYHLLPEHWGRGHASALVRALVDLATRHLPGQGPLNGLVRPANPASARVLAKNGFARAEDLILGGAPTIRYTRAI